MWKIYTIQRETKVYVRLFLRVCKFSPTFDTVLKPPTIKIEHSLLCKHILPFNQLTLPLLASYIPIKHNAITYFLNRYIKFLTCF